MFHLINEISIFWLLKPLLDEFLSESLQALWEFPAEKDDLAIFAKVKPS